VNNQPETGSVNYTPRAIRQDTLDAMRGDIVIGLIEFITNSDDAYRKIKRKGNIDIEFSNELRPFKYSILVRDYARGLSGEELKEKFINIGKENTDNNIPNNGEEGTRGLFGRGAKDVAVFGKARFSTIHNGKYSSLEIDGFNWNYKIFDLDVVATKEHYKQLELAEGESGFIAKVFVTETRATAMPSAKKLIERLSNHVALRNINETHQIIFKDLRVNNIAILKPKKAKGRLVIDQEVEVKGYESKAILRIWHLLERETGDCDEYSIHGIIIKDNKTNFQNTFLDLKARPEIGWFAGQLICPEIDELNRQFDENENNRDSVDLRKVEKNPIRLAKKSRDGLDRQHPYYRSLTIVLNEHLKPLMDTIAKEEIGEKTISEDLQKKLDDVSQSLAQLLQDTLDEEDLEGDFDAGTGPEDSEILIVPPVKIFEKGTTGTLSVWIPAADFDPKSVSLSIIDSNNFSIQQGKSELNFELHPSRPVYRASIKVEASGFGSTELLLTYKGESVQAKLQCTPEMPDEILMIEEILWERDHSYLVPMRKRALKLFAPASMHKESISIVASNSIAIVDTTAEFRLAKSKGYCIAKVQVQAGREEGTFELTAKNENVEASTNVTIKEISLNKGPNIKIDPKDQDSITRSSLFSLPGLLSIQIYLKHKGIRKLLGTHDGFQYKNIDSALVKAVISEIVAVELANYVIESDFTKKPHLYRDPASTIRKQKELTTRFNVAMQSSLLSELI
jgi:hypothetical protein